MKRIVLIGVALFASTLALTNSASARLGIAPLAAQDDAVIRVRGGHGHGHGHMHRGGRRWQAQVGGDAVDRHYPVAQVAEDPQPWFARERLEHVERPAVSLARIDMGAPSQD